MSGKRHHYLPQFLLSGFSHRRTGKDSYCWVYRRNQKPHESNIKNVGVEGYFYGKPETSKVDDIITQEEGEYAVQIQLMRNKGSLSAFTDTEISQLVVHLALRTRHVRKTFSSAVDQLVAEISEVMSDPDNVKRLMLNSIRNKPEILRESMIDELEERGIRGQLTPDQERRFLDFVQTIAPIIIEQSPETDNSMLLQALDLMKEKIPETMKSGHIRALGESSSPQQRVEHLSQLDWQVLVFPKHSIILGDVGAWAIKYGESEPTAFTWAGNNIELVVLPISHSHVLVGKTRSREFTLEAQYVNDVSASLSLDYFVSSRANANRQQLVETIGIKAMETINESIRDATDGLID